MCLRQPVAKLLALDAPTATPLFCCHCIFSVFPGCQEKNHETAFAASLRTSPIPNLSSRLPDSCNTAKQVSRHANTLTHTTHISIYGMRKKVIRKPTDREQQMVCSPDPTTRQHAKSQDLTRPSIFKFRLLIRICCFSTAQEQRVRIVCWVVTLRSCQTILWAKLRGYRMCYPVNTAAPYNSRKIGRVRVG